MEWYYILIIVLGTVLLLLALFALLCNKIAFGRRFDRIPLVKYFTAPDFGLTVRGFSIGKLQGFTYENESTEPRNEVVVFCHGMGPGHIAYTTEIAYFCNLGYTVVATDSLGCGYSRGRNIRGMYEGVKTVIKAVQFAKIQYKDQKIYFVGHSWGGYSALCASARTKVEKVVAISAPDTPARTIQNGAAQAIGRPLAAILKPFFWLTNLFKFGAAGNSSAAKCAKKSGVPTLLIHGDSDNIVNFGNSAFKNAEGGNITKLSAQGKMHNPYNTQNAEKLLSELSKALSSAKNMEKSAHEEYFKSFDYVGATEEDAEIMAAISNFLQS